MLIVAIPPIFLLINCTSQNTDLAMLLPYVNLFHFNCLTLFLFKSKFVYQSYHIDCGYMLIWLKLHATILFAIQHLNPNITESAFSSKVSRTPSFKTLFGRYQLPYIGHHGYPISCNISTIFMILNLTTLWCDKYRKNQSFCSP